MTSEKLDILMKITDTRNSALAKALSFDPSYIGRIRTGKRGIPKHMPFVEPAAAFFQKILKRIIKKSFFQKQYAVEKRFPKIGMSLKSFWPHGSKRKEKTSPIQALQIYFYMNFQMLLHLIFQFQLQSRVRKQTSAVQMKKNLLIFTEMPESVRLPSIFSADYVQTKSRIIFCFFPMRI